MSYLGNRSAEKVAQKLNSEQTRFQTHSRSIQIVPNLFSTYLFWPILLGIQNFEVYVKPIMGSMDKFLKRIVSFHKKHGGRSELRYNGDALAIDFAIKTPRRAFQFLRENGYLRVALHIGKRIVDCDPCERVRLANL